MTYCKIYENADVGLHDARTDRITSENGYLTFYFPNGFAFIGDTGATQAQKGEMRCRLIGNGSDGFSARIFKKSPFVKGLVRKDVSKEFISGINEGKFKFEFVTTYRAYQTVLFKGYIWYDKAPYFTECEIEIDTDEIVYKEIK